MYQFGENQPHRTDFRPEVHDSDGLMVATRRRRMAVAPLINPTNVLATSFSMPELQGFGLMQRDRRFASYEDPEARYDLRPSAWVEPVGSWGPGRVELVQIPTPDETNDNIVAYWVPSSCAAAGEPLDFAYRPALAGRGVAQRPPGRGSCNRASAAAIASSPTTSTSSWSTSRARRSRRWRRARPSKPSSRRRRAARSSRPMRTRRGHRRVAHDGARSSNSTPRGRRAARLSAERQRRAHGDVEQPRAAKSRSAGPSEARPSGRCVATQRSNKKVPERRQARDDGRDAREETPAQPVDRPRPRRAHIEGRPRHVAGPENLHAELVAVGR